MLAKTRRHDVMFGNMQWNSLLKCLWYETFHIVLRWLGILCNIWIGTWKFLKKLYAQSMPILAWTFSGKNTKILTKNKALIFVSYTLQDVIAISYIKGWFISSVLKVKVNPNPWRKLTRGKQLTLLFVCFRAKFSSQKRNITVLWKRLLIFECEGVLKFKKVQNNIGLVQSLTNGLEKFIHVRDFYRTQPLRQNRTEKITV